MRNPLKAFTLAELLVALAILGVIATFTIPKVLTAQSDQQKKAAAKEVAGMLADMYNTYKLQNTVTGSTTPSVMTSTLNYVSVTTMDVDERNGANAASCSSLYVCLKLHNGGVLFYDAGLTFAGTANTNAIWFGFDPDGAYSGNSTGPGKAVKIWLYINGKITSFDNITPGTCTSTGCFPTGISGTDPSWFSWN